MKIPVFHDDQHGTAIIGGAALLNALEVAGKRIEDVRVVFSGSGASGIAIANMFLTLGVRKSNILFTDSKGVVYKGRTDGMNPYKEAFARETPMRTLSEAMRGADVFVGVSAAGLVTQDMVRTMADRPIVFALANPDPEIGYADARAARPDVIVATGRSDYPEPGEQRARFSVHLPGRAGRAGLHDQRTDEGGRGARPGRDWPGKPFPSPSPGPTAEREFRFGPEYLIPKPFDPRVLVWEASAVAKAAMESGVAQVSVDIEEYKRRLQERIKTKKF